MEKRVFELACRTDLNVLIQGKTGTGKSTLAQKIHRESVRASAPFVCINLATLHEGTLESELFGHERGSFTGAEQRRQGKLESAQGGTVFLDEIAELSPRLQGRLLEFLQTRTVSAVGSNKEMKLDVRVIVATHQDLEQAVRDKKFREDLFHRIRVLNLNLKPLRDFQENFGDIVQDLITEIARQKNRRVLRIAPEFARKIESYPWPGNFRELRNFLEYTVLIDQDEVLGLDDCPSWFLDASKKLLEEHPRLNSELGCLEIPISGRYHETIQTFERLYIQKMFEKHRGRVNETARKIGLSKATLIRRLKDYRLNDECSKSI